MFHERYDPAYECDWARGPIAHMVNVRSQEFGSIAGLEFVHFFPPFLFPSFMTIQCFFSTVSAFRHRRLELWTLYDSPGFAAAFGVELHPHRIGEGYQARCGE